MSTLHDHITADRPLYRSTADRKVTGVCGGIAERYGLDASLVRLGFVAATFLGGVGLPLYVVAALVVPSHPAVVPPPIAPGEPMGEPMGDLVTATGPAPSAA